MNQDFVDRFTEVCGTSQPAKIAQVLNISYQAAKNYLHGRLPDSNVLKTIAETTPYSINWLLTGQGEKYVESAAVKDTLRLSDQMRTFIRRECLEVIGELLADQKDQAPAKVFVLTSENIKEEKITDESSVFSEKRS